MRVPDHPVARDILAAFGRPVVAPSANRSGHVSPTTAQHVLADLRGRIDLIVDGGPTPVGVESTIVACLGEPMLLRPGGVPRAEIERVLGRSLDDPADASIRTTRRSRPASSPRIMRRAAGCGSMRRTSRLARRCWPSAQCCRRTPRALRALNLSAARRPDRGRRQPVLAPARARCRGRRRHRRDAGAARRPRRGDQRPADAGGCAAAVTWNIVAARAIVRASKITSAA